VAWIIGVKRLLAAAQAAQGKALDAVALDAAITGKRGQTKDFPGINAQAAALIRQKLIDAGSAADDGNGGLALTAKGTTEDPTKWQPALEVVVAPPADTAKVN
jgi:hypothetical protein